MNIQLKNYARRVLKEDLAKCTEVQQHFFKRLYANGNLNLSINKVIDQMPVEKLDWAMQQVEQTLAKNKKKD